MPGVASEPTIDERELQQLAMELLTVPSVSSEGATRQIAALARGWLKDQGLHTVDLGPKEHPAILAKMGPWTQPPTLLLSAHLDVVPAVEAEWKVPPFRPELKGGRLWGRGAADMKAGAAAMMAALDACARAGTAEGSALLLTTDEETHMQGALAAASDERLAQVAGILVGEATRLHRAVGHKGLLQFKLTARGTAAHASEPEEGTSAVLELLSCLKELRQMPGLWTGRGPSLPKRTLNIGRIEGGTKVNVLPSDAWAECDVRFPVEEEPGVVERRVRAVSKRHRRVRYDRVHLLPPVVTEPNHLLARIVEKASGSMERNIAPYATDAARFQPGGGTRRRVPVPTIVLGPGDPAVIHKADEQVPWDQVARAARIYARVVTEWHGERSLSEPLERKGLLGRLRRG